ncbi:CheR family methyltransferase [Phenylobacterium deserti]|uniref:protein-glutamate O-methyltransferase n=1 Tax=Phenylobacterium deserti TaxID=1914756 RepID=A0A328AVV3_9CAUL|nr:protein-glutamate O-methyltransferase CheR [Phenylobacterium deserti]RAK57694.1 chemotaxis protein CheR [Phenylobacterium deserti]
MTPREREFIAKLCAARAGLSVPADKDYLLESRLAPVARREGFGSVAELVQALRGRADEVQVWASVEAMTLPDTAFFRDGEVLEALWSALPAMAQRGSAPLRIWSAGCASGQEIYSLAMLLEERPIPGVQVELFASDIAERQLEKAQAGVYSQFEVQRGLSARRLIRHFEKRDEAFLLSRRVRQHVRWRRVNLVEDLTSLGQFDVVLCRHVLSGLTNEGRNRAVDGLVQAVAPGGLLVLSPGDDVGDRLPTFLGVPGAFGGAPTRRSAAA